MPLPKTAIVTDLDGTLLDHHDYGFEPARAVLARLARLEIPVVLASSKTAAEMRKIAADMPGVARWPFICENGAGVVWPGRAASDDEREWQKLRAAMDGLPSELRSHLTGFGDLGAAGIAEVTGLSLAAAARAGQRQFSEPCLWDGDDAALERLQKLLGQAGIMAQRGGRFLTLGTGHTKADRIGELRDALGVTLIVAIGDAPNDRAMIAAADIGVVVPNPNGASPGGFDASQDVRTAHAAGPTGWAMAVSAILNEIGFDKEEEGAAHG